MIRKRPAARSIIKHRAFFLSFAADLQEYTREESSPEDEETGARLVTALASAGRLHVGLEPGSRGPHVPAGEAAVVGFS